MPRRAKKDPETPRVEVVRSRLHDAARASGKRLTPEVVTPRSRRLTAPTGDGGESSSATAPAVIPTPAKKVGKAKKPRASRGTAKTARR